MKWRIFQSFSRQPEARHSGDKADSGKRTPEKITRQEWIPVEQLRIGMFVSKLDIPWEQSTFLFQGMEIRSSDEIEEVKKQCRKVWVDYQVLQETGETEQVVNANKSETDEEVEGKISIDQIRRDYEEAESLVRKTTTAVSRLFENIAAGKVIDATEVQQSVNRSIDLVMKSPDAALWLTRLNESDDELAQHSFNVSALSILLGHAADLPRASLEELGMCALMHDIGKILLKKEREASEKPDQLSVEALESHVNIGFNILSESTGVDSRLAAAVLYHHENFDGSGYPHGLKAGDIPLYSRVIALADTYDKLINGKTGQQRVSQFTAIDTLYKSSGKAFDEELAIKFIEVIGLYPAGTLVELTNGEVGIVLSTSRHKVLPTIVLVLDRKKQEAPLCMLDLSMMIEDGDGNPYQIKSTLEDGSFGIYLKDYKMAGLKLA